MKIEGRHKGSLRNNHSGTDSKVGGEGVSHTTIKRHLDQIVKVNKIQ